ncbi:MAG: Zn-dependent hydrolase [Pelosinus sp.]|nr:Zn-dependent hydrolase [Pelosinus sp.]
MNEEWIVNEIDKIARFSQSGAGVTRSSLSEQAAKARQYVASLMTDAGLVVRIDQIGNVIGRLATKENSERAVVMAGSHLDTAEGSSKYDGILGILSAIAATDKLKAESLRHPIEIIAFAGEEAGRFGISMLGSKALTGKLGTRTLASAKDNQGTSLASALLAQGFDVKTVAAAAVSAAKSKAFLELYVEQGRIFEKEDAQIGIAQQITGTTKCKITVNGCAAHAGIMPMDERHDALVSAAMIILAVQEVAQESEFATLATVSDLKVSPGTIQAVPGVVEMWIDICGAEQEGIIETLQEIKDAISVIAENQETSVAIEIFSAERPVKMSSVVAAAVEEACKASGLAHCYIDSGSRHDAASMSSLTPSGIIFIPCQSDHQEDYVAPTDIQAGLNVLTQALYQLAK